MQGNNSDNYDNNMPESLRFLAGAESIMAAVVSIDLAPRVNRGLVCAS